MYTTLTFAEVTRAQKALLPQEQLQLTQGWASCCFFDFLRSPLPSLSGNGGPQSWGNLRGPRMLARCGQCNVHDIPERVPIFPKSSSQGDLCIADFSQPVGQATGARKVHQLPGRQAPQRLRPTPCKLTLGWATSCHRPWRKTKGKPSVVASECSDDQLRTRLLQVGAAHHLQLAHSVERE